MCCIFAAAAEYSCFPYPNMQTYSNTITTTETIRRNRLHIMLLSQSRQRERERNEMKWNKLSFYLHVVYGWCHFDYNKIRSVYVSSVSIRISWKWRNHRKTVFLRCWCFTLLCFGTVRFGFVCFIGFYNVQSASNIEIISLTQYYFQPCVGWPGQYWNTNKRINEQVSKETNNVTTEHWSLVHWHLVRQ